MRVAAGRSNPKLISATIMNRISNGAKPLVPPGAWIFSSVQLLKES